MCVASISHLGFLAATWVLDLSLLHPVMQDPSITDLAHVRLVLSWPMDVDVIWNLEISPKSVEVFLLDGRPKIIHCLFR